MSADFTDTELLDALEHYAWRVSSEPPEGGGGKLVIRIRADQYTPVVLGEADTVREALAVALVRAGAPQTTQHPTSNEPV